MEDFEYLPEEEYGMEYGPEMYMFEPEYTAEELVLRNEARLNIASSQIRDENIPQRTASLFWCTCRHCELKATPNECMCCQEWPEWTWKPYFGEDEDVEVTGTSSEGGPAAAADVCVTQREDLVHILAEITLTTFFHTDKVNWKKKPKPAGENGQLSVE